MSTTKDLIAKIEKEYPAGSRIQLIHMDDIQAPEIGTMGTVVGVDDAANILVDWDNGSSLNVIYGIDTIKRVDRKVSDCV